MIKENNSLFCEATESLSPVADFLNLLSNLVSPERDEKHHALADLTLKQTKQQNKTQVASSRFCPSPLNQRVHLLNQDQFKLGLIDATSAAKLKWLKAQN